MGDITSDNHLGHLLLKYMRHYADILCQIDAATGQQESYASVLKRSIRLAKCLRKCGFKPGDILAIGGYKHLDIRIPFYGAIFNGLPIVGVDPYYKYDEIKTLFKIVLPKVVFCDEELYDTYLNVIKDLGLDTKIIIFGNGENSMKQLLQNDDDEPGDNFTVAEFDVDKIYLFLISTSGTTGNVKVAAFKQQPFVMKVFDFVQPNPLFEGSKTLCLSPINWVSAYFTSVCAPQLGQSIVQSSVPDNIDIVIDMINKYKPVSSMMGPSLAVSLLSRKDEVDLTCFYYVALTGSRVYPDLLLQFKSLMREGASLYEAYGLTENIGPVLKCVPGTPLGSCGKSYSSYILRLIDPDSGNEIKEPNVPGELYVKGASMTEYFNDPDETAKAFSEDGFFKTGDLLYRDENNFYYFVERKKTLIKCRNFHIVPAELQEVIRSHSDVSDVCVVGIEDPEDGQRPVACIVRRNDIVTALEIKKLVADKLSKNKELRGGVVFLKEFPKTSTGKVATKKLVEIVRNSKRE